MCSPGEPSAKALTDALSEFRARAQRDEAARVLAPTRR